MFWVWQVVEALEARQEERKKSTIKKRQECEEESFSEENGRLQKRWPKMRKCI